MVVVVRRGNDGLAAEGERVYWGEGIAAVDSLDTRDGIVDAAAARDVADRIGHGLQGSIVIIGRSEIVCNSASGILSNVLAGTVPKPPRILSIRGACSPV